MILMNIKNFLFVVVKNAIRILMRITSNVYFFQGVIDIFILILAMSEHMRGLVSGLLQFFFSSVFKSSQ